MLSAFTDGVNRGIVAAAHVLVDDDPPLNVEPCGLGEVRVWPNAGGDHDHVAVQADAILHGNTGHVAIPNTAVVDLSR